MKVQTKQDQFEELAKIAFAQILGNIYSDVRLFAMMGEAAVEKKRTPAEEIANQACESAAAMQKEILKRTKA